jgi:hypothetical protein
VCSYDCCCVFTLTLAPVVVVTVALTRALSGVLTVGVAVLLVAVCVYTGRAYGGSARPITREAKPEHYPYKQSKRLVPGITNTSLNSQRQTYKF